MDPRTPAALGRGLRAVVVGAGLAGEGHTLALRHWGVEVVALCARQPDVVRGVAERLGVPEASTDWRRTLETVRPELVAVATPGGLRGPVVEAAAALGCHLYCEKPLAPTAAEAERLYRVAAAAGVKHAYAATQRYDPGVAWLAELVRGGAVGRLREVEGTFRLQAFPSPRVPWSWQDDLASGGGVLNNGLPHWLGTLATVLDGEPVRVVGAAQPAAALGRAQAPVVPGVHDVRALQDATPDPEAAAGLVWRACDADLAFTALLRYSGGAAGVPVTVTANAAAAPVWPPSGWRLYGDEGVLVADGVFTYDVARHRGPAGEREALPVPDRLRVASPVPGRPLVNTWAALAREFLADVRGAPHAPYLTFRDGWRYQAAAEAIRLGRGWHELLG